MRRILKFIREWAAVLACGIVAALLLFALAVCMAQVDKGTGIFPASFGIAGCIIAIGIFLWEIVADIKDRRKG